ncbi:chloride channel [Geranomyces variabilis]|nr:chloride channel [Geranomyces variabilis]KAJ3135504.1 hypothetical protein HDU90_003907 [Geranomyces variabilis]
MPAGPARSAGDVDNHTQPASSPAAHARFAEDDRSSIPANSGASTPPDSHVVDVVPDTPLRRPLPRSDTVAGTVLVNKPLTQPSVVDETEHHVADDVNYKRYESIAFEEPDGPGLRRHYYKQGRWDRVIEEVTQYLFATFTALQFSGLFIFLVWGTERLAHRRLHHIAELVDHSVAQAFLFAIWTSLVATIVPAVMILLWAPASVGSGMVQLIAALNGASIKDKPSLFNLGLRYLGIWAVAVGGLYSGSDGPMALLGATVAVNLVLNVKKRGWIRRWFYGENPISRNADLAIKAGRNALFTFLEQKALRLFATLGAAVAVSAIFRSPLGGVMFALEETTSFFERGILIRTLYCTMVAALLVGFKLPGILDRHELQQSLSAVIPLPSLFPANVDCVRPFPMHSRQAFAMLGAYALLGIFMAGFGNLWNRSLSRVQALRLPAIAEHLLDQSYAKRPKRSRVPGNPETPPNLDTPADTLKPPVRRRRRVTIKIGPRHPKAYSPKRRQVILWKILEVGVVVVITALIVVGVPAIKGADPCVRLDHATAHAAGATPAVCSEGVAAGNLSLTNERFSECLHGLGSVCLPRELKNQYQESVIQNFYTGNQAASTAVVKKEGAVSEPESSAPATNLTQIVEGAIAPVMNLTRFIPGLRAKNLLVRLEPAQRVNALQRRQEVSPAPPEAVLAHEAEPLAPKADLEAFNVDEADECYFQLRSLLLSMPEAQLEMLLTRGLYGLFDVQSLVIFLIVYKFLALLTYYIALPTDLVVPNLISGAATGRLLGLAWNAIAVTQVDPGAVALLGAAGLWSATSGMVLTVVVICFEVTGDSAVIPALIIVAFTSAWISSFLGESLYHREMHVSGTPFLPAEPHHYLRTVKIRKIMHHRHLVVVGCTARLSSVKDAINSGHHGFPVVEKLKVQDQTGKTWIRYRPVGLVDRDLLIATLADLRKEGHDMDARLDLARLMNVSPTIVRDDATAAKVYSVFRTLGLRNVMVVDDNGFLVGLVGRKDFLRAAHAHKHHRKKYSKEELAQRRKTRRETRMAQQNSARTLGESGLVLAPFEEDDTKAQDPSSHVVSQQPSEPSAPATQPGGALTTGGRANWQRGMAQIKIRRAFAAAPALTVHPRRGRDDSSSSDSSSSSSSSGDGSSSSDDSDDSSNDGVSDAGIVEDAFQEMENS